MANPLAGLDVAALFKQFQEETQGQVSTPQGGLTPPGQFGTQTVAPPASMLGPVNQSPFQQAAAMPDAPEVRPTLGTRDLPAALLALLAGNQGGQVIQGYLGGKVQQAGQQTQRNQAEVDRKRQALIAQGQSAEKALDRASLEKRSENTLTGTQYRADKTLEGVVKKGVFSTDIAKLRAKAATDVADARSDDKRFTDLVGMATKGTPEERAYALDALTGYDEFSGLTPAQVAAGANLTAAELEKKAGAALKTAQIDKIKAEVGYLGIRGRDIEKMQGPKIEALKATAARARQGVQTEIQRAKLLESQAGLIEEKTKYYEPEFRARVARYAASGAKVGGSNDLKDLSVRRAGWAGLYRTATDQINKIRKDNKGEPPMLAFDPDGFAAYMKVVQDQEEARKNLDEIDKIKTKGLNPVTSGRTSNFTPAKPGTATAGPLQVSGPIGGGGYQPNTTSGGVKWRKLP